MMAKCFGLLDQCNNNRQQTKLYEINHILTSSILSPKQGWNQIRNKSQCR